MLVMSTLVFSFTNIEKIMARRKRESCHISMNSTTYYQFLAILIFVSESFHQIIKNKLYVFLNILKMMELNISEMIFQRL